MTETSILPWDLLGDCTWRARGIPSPFRCSSTAAAWALCLASIASSNFASSAPTTCSPARVRKHSVQGSLLWCNPMHLLATCNISLKGQEGSQGFSMQRREAEYTCFPNFSSTKAPTSSIVTSIPSPPELNGRFGSCLVRNQKSVFNSDVSRCLFESSRQPGIDGFEACAAELRRHRGGFRPSKEPRCQACGGVRGGRGCHGPRLHRCCDFLDWRRRHHQ